MYVPLVAGGHGRPAREKALSRCLNSKAKGTKTNTGRDLPVNKWTVPPHISALNPMADAEEVPNAKRYSKLLSESTFPSLQFRASSISNKF